jgi:hypothetical protein
MVREGHTATDLKPSSEKWKKKNPGFQWFLLVSEFPETRNHKTTKPGKLSSMY